MGKSNNLKVALAAQQQAKQAKGSRDETRMAAKSGAMYRRLTTTEKAKYHLS